MPMPTITDIKPDIDIGRDKSTDLLIASVALEELGLAHLINTEAEKIQFVLGTLGDHGPRRNDPPAPDELLRLNKSAEKMMRLVIENEIILSFKLESAIELLKTTSKKDAEIKELRVSYSDPVYTGHGSNRVGSTTVTLTFILSDGTSVIKTETFNDINTTTSKDFSYAISVYYVTVNVTVTAEGENNNMNITGVSARITNIIKQ